MNVTQHRRLTLALYAAAVAIVAVPAVVLFGPFGHARHTSVAPSSTSSSGSGIDITTVKGLSTALPGIGGVLVQKIDDADDDDHDSDFETLVEDDCLSGDRSASAEMVAPAVHAHYVDSDGDDVYVTLDRAVPSTMPAYVRAVTTAKLSCEGFGRWQASDNPNNYMSDVLTRINSVQLGDASVEYRATEQEHYLDTDRVIGPETDFDDTYVYVVSTSWNIKFQVSGLQPEVDAVVALVLPIVDKRLGTHFAHRRGSAATPGCGTPTADSIDKAAIPRAVLQNVYVLHDAACRQDLETLSLDMAQSFMVQDADLSSAQALSAMRAQLVAGTLTRIWEVAPVAAPGAYYYRVGGGAIEIGGPSSYATPVWEAYIADCSAAVGNGLAACGRAGVSLSAADVKTAMAPLLDCSGTLGDEIDVDTNSDITGDGKDDVFVAASCRAPTGGTPDILAVYNGAVEPPHLLGVLIGYNDGTDNRGLEVNSISVRGASVVVKSYGYLTSDNICCSLTVTDTFAWNGTSFAHVNRVTHQGT